MHDLFSYIDFLLSVVIYSGELMLSLKLMKQWVAKCKLMLCEVDVISIIADIVINIYYNNVLNVD